VLAYVVVQTIEVSHTQEDALFPVIVQALVGLAKAQADSPEWELILFSAISALLKSVQGKLETKLATELDKNAKNINNVVFALLSLVTSLQNQPRLHHPEIFSDLQKQVVGVFLTAFSTHSIKLKHLVVQLVRSMVQATAAAPATPAFAFKYLRDVGPHVSLAVYKINNNNRSGPITADEELLINEEVKLLTLAHTLSPENYRSKLLHVVIPCLTHLLQPQLHPTLPPVHTVSLQVLLHLASTSAHDFKEVVSTMSPEDKATLETSVRQSLAAANAVATKTTTQAAPSHAPRQALKLDLSKYGK